MSTIKQAEGITMKVMSISWIFLTIGLVLVSCSHQSATESSGPNRYVASQTCPVKGEYHSYFDQVENCMEKAQKK